MLKKTLVFNDFDGNPHTETCYFNMTETEFLLFYRSKPGGVAGFIQEMIERQDEKELTDFWMNFIVNSYGIKSSDGLHFEKSPEIANKFKSTMYFDRLFIELNTNEESAKAFFKGVIPKDLLDKAEAAKTS